MVDILQQLQESANAQKTFADRLREERMARTSTLSQYKQQTNPTDLYSSNGVPLAPSQVFSGQQALANAFQGALAPYSPELEQKALGSQSDILSQILQLQQNQQKIDQTAIPEDKTLDTIKTIQALRKDAVDQGIDTKIYDDMLKGYGITPANAKVGEEEVNGVNLINNILSSSDYDLAGSSGRIKAGKLLNYGDTAKLRNELKKLSSVLQLASVGKLKGQGQVSDAERRILAESVTSLGLSDKGTTDLSASELKNQLTEIRAALAKKSNDPDLIAKYGVAGGNTETPKPSVNGFIIEEVR